MIGCGQVAQGAAHDCLLGGYEGTDDSSADTLPLQPFRAQNPINPSWEIARSLPPFLPPAEPSSKSEVSVLAEQRRVRILVHPEPVKVAYKTVRPLVPKLWEGQKIDYMIHIGMASGRRFYSVERRGHRDGYLMRDVDNEFLGDAEREESGEPCEWDGMPEELLTDADIDDIWKRWRIALPVCIILLGSNGSVLTEISTTTFECRKIPADTCATLYTIPALHI
jgi:hypothetical protein